MLILGIESSCDETGIALYDAAHHRLLAHALHSQIAMHQHYGGVVPELASRDHIRRLSPLLHTVMADSGHTLLALSGIAYTQGPGLSGALLVGTAFAEGLALSLNLPVIPVHHLEGHLLSPLLSDPAPDFPFVALLVSGGHTQLMRVDALGEYTLLGESLDDAAGEAFDKTAKLLGLPYPGGAELSRLAEAGRPNHIDFPRPMLHSKDLNFSFSGLKTAALTRIMQTPALDDTLRADIARGFQEAIIEVLVEKSIRALTETGLKRLVVAGGVGANRALREALNRRARRHGVTVFYPDLRFCTDNGAMIALAGGLRFRAGKSIKAAGTFCVRPRWPLAELSM